MVSPEAEEILERLTPSERLSLLQGLTERSRKKAKDDALVAADWLEALLRVAKEPELAAMAGTILKRLREKA